MAVFGHIGRRASVALAVAIALVFALSTNFAALANVSVTQLSTDPYANSSSQHKTEVEPDTFSFGATIVSAFQVGRFTDGGASNIGWATSTDGGATWHNGFLPGITTFGTPAGSYDRVSDPSVAYDAAHTTWMISSLVLRNVPNSAPDGVGVVVNRSTDGGLTWSNPVTVASHSGLDKNWTSCDNVSTTYAGHCYTELDDKGAGNTIHMSTSTDGGINWGAALNTANSATGLGGQPVVQPNGTVVVPIANANETAILAFRSTNGGASWSATATVAAVRDHTVAGNLRTDVLPSAEIDAAGTVYVVWQDCRFRRGCASNDIVMSTSPDGFAWSAVVRIPIDATSSKVDHFIPGLAVDPATSGTSAHLGLAYYYYPDTKCSTSTCRLSVGFVSSVDGGTSWNSPTQLAGPMTVTWLASTTQGYMVGDYISTSFAGGTAHPAFAVATAKSGTAFNEAMFSTASGLAIAAGNFVVTSSGDHAVPNAASDHAAPNAPITHH
jgi:hypothetical protein